MNAPTNRRSDARLPRALIVDDMRVNRRVLGVHLKRLGYVCREAMNGHEAVEACRRERPDVVLLDVLMPVMDGFAALTEIRALPGCDDLPVILLTGLSADEISARARAEGAQAVLEKPPDAKKLACALNRHVRVAGGRRRSATRKAAPDGGRRQRTRTRVLVVDDSALVRELLSQILNADPELEVVGTARDAERAWTRIQKLAPDVLTLDVEMPGMDGLAFLERLMRLRPLPVLMVSSLTQRGSAATLRALELGAVDFISKPRVDIRGGTNELAEEIVSKVKMAAKACVPGAPHKPIERTPRAEWATHDGGLIAIGASTGGPRALAAVLAALPADLPPLLITQHMPASFTASFASRLNGCCPQDVHEAQGGEHPQRGQVFIARGDAHLRVVSGTGGAVLALDSGAPVNHHRPSVDVLFESVARCFGAEAVGALLTGMGADGAKGLAAIRAAGGRTIAQDEQTSLVYGMPRVAAQIGAAEFILPLERVPGALVKLVATTVVRRRRA